MLRIFLFFSVNDGKPSLSTGENETVPPIGTLDSQFVKETGPQGLQFRYIKDDVTFIPLADVENESYHVYFLAEGSTKDQR